MSVQVAIFHSEFTSLLEEFGRLLSKQPCTEHNGCISHGTLSNILLQAERTQKLGQELMSMPNSKDVPKHLVFQKLKAVREIQKRAEEYKCNPGTQVDTVIGDSLVRGWTPQSKPEQTTSFKLDVSNESEQIPSEKGLAIEFINRNPLHVDEKNLNVGFCFSDSDTYTLDMSDTAKVAPMAASKKQRKRTSENKASQSKNQLSSSWFTYAIVSIVMCVSCLLTAALVF